MASSALLELQGVTKLYRSEAEVIKAVDDVSLKLDAGELAALYGPSGSGKTTLLQVAAGIALPDAGVVTYQGVDIGSLSDRAREIYRRDQLGFVFQSWQLQPGLSALDNAATKVLAAGLSPRAARTTAMVMLKRLGLESRSKHLPHQLSTGERQRVGIARALLNDPKVILADEPTGNLDSERTEMILDLLAEACRERGVAVLLVTHDPRAAECADRVLLFRDGKIEPSASETPAVIETDGATAASG